MHYSATIEWYRVALVLSIIQMAKSNEKLFPFNQFLFNAFQMYTRFCSFNAIKRKKCILCCLFDTFSASSIDGNGPDLVSAKCKIKQMISFQRCVFLPADELFEVWKCKTLELMMLKGNTRFNCRQHRQRWWWQEWNGMEWTTESKRKENHLVPIQCKHE